MLILIILAVALAASAQTSRSIWDGVYTQEQANRGKTAYAEQCASCHGVELGGGSETPGLTDEKFLGKWQNHSADGLFASMRASIPVGRTGTLSRPICEGRRANRAGQAHGITDHGLQGGQA